MLNKNQILRGLKRSGFRLQYGDGSIIKIYPPDKTQPFYTFHFGETGLHPLRRFAKTNWGIDINDL